MSEKVDKLIDFAAHGTPEAPVGSQEWIWGVTNSAEHCLAEVQPHVQPADHIPEVGKMVSIPTVGEVERVEAWLNEIEGYGLRAERLVEQTGCSLETLLPWLVAAASLPTPPVAEKGAELLEELKEAVATLRMAIDPEAIKGSSVIGAYTAFVQTEARLRAVTAPEGMPDGIECRDETIKLQAENIERLKARAEKAEAERDAMGEALRNIADATYPPERNEFGICSHDVWLSEGCADCVEEYAMLVLTHQGGGA